MCSDPQMFFIHEASALQRGDQHRIRTVISGYPDKSLQVLHVSGKRLCISGGILFFLVIVSKLDKQEISCTNFLLYGFQSPLVHKAFGASAVLGMVYYLILIFNK